MHKNYRRKIKFRNPKRRYHVKLKYYKQEYWAKQRARERELLYGAGHKAPYWDIWLECHSGNAYEDCQDRHPKTVLWDAL